MSGLVFKIFKKTAYQLRGYHLNRFFIVRSSLNILLKILKPKSVIVDGNKMYLDKNDSMRLSILGIYEPLMVEHFQKSIKEGDTVLDIGAHIGYYTLMAAKRVGKRGKVLAFEPIDENCELIYKNLKVNKYENVTLFKKAVSNSTRKAKFFLSRNSSGMHSLVNIGYNSGGQKTVETINLDDFFGKNIPQVSVIKMDIEGGEYLALEGMKKLIKKSKNLKLFTEFSPYSIKRSKKSPGKFLDNLKNLGFGLFAIDETEKKLSPVNIQKFISSCPMDRDWHINLLAVK